MEQIATVNVDIYPCKIPLKLDMYVEGVYKKAKKYFIIPVDSYDPLKSRISITDEEGHELLKRMIT